MPLFPINNAGAVGIVSDRLGTEIPFNAWTSGKNVRFRDGYVEKFLGESAVFGTPTVVPYWLLPVATPTTYFWIYAGLAKVYVTDGATHTDLTRAAGGDYTTSTQTNWTGCVLGGIPILNNGLDDPQMWSPVSITQRLQLLTNWPANTKCSALRSYKNFLVALDVTKTGTRIPQMVKWSHPAPAGGVPATWDPTDATKDAGEYVLAETGGFCVDCLPLRDVNVIYKDDSIHGMQFIGGLSVFRFFRMPFKDLGILSRRCVVEIPPGRHAVFGQGDCVWHDGQNIQSILGGKTQKWLFNRMDSGNVAKSFVFHSFSRSEVWFCFCETGVSTPNLAVVWNYKDGTSGIRDLNGISHIEPGIVNPGATSDSWAGDTAPWSSDTTVWGARNFNPAVMSPLQAGTGGTKLLRADDTSQFNESNMTVLVERKGLGLPTKVGAPPDLSTMKFYDTLWPRIEGTLGGIVNISIGVHDKPTDDPVYAAPVPYVIGTSVGVDILQAGRLLALKFQSVSNLEWRLNGYEVDMRPMGIF